MEYLAKISTNIDDENWNFYLKKDLSLVLYHNCNGEKVFTTWKNGIECTKDQKKFSPKISNNNGIICNSIKAEINIKNTKRKASDLSILNGDPLVIEQSLISLDNVQYKYLKYTLGFSIIQHRAYTMWWHTSTIFLNDCDDNLFELSEETPCKECSTITTGTSLKNFLQIYAKLKDDK